ncbi:MAG: 1-deoxy-D-xylulose-5-phosphate reductoisomerase [Planctomycetota bacterium]|nr:1-deoxy-D-xylulose-5-phosphate reductoisomerase [Planctomycetota bacterium]
MKTKRVAILGSTGSIGRQSLEVVRELPGISVCALAAGSNEDLLAEQARASGAEIVALARQSADALRGKLPAGVKLIAGPEAATELIRQSRPDVVLSGIVGTAGLKPALAAIDCGATLAIANKETLVMAGAIVMPAARDAGVAVLPVDSEHSAIFQCLSAGKRQEVQRVVITASGGALRDWDAEAVKNATVEDALNHPTWNMGRKITVDSATLINKALEVVEAHWLFGLSAEQIEVVIHPESIVHSAVEFCDGSVIAQMGRPDMTGPIAYALSYPDRAVRQVAPLDLPALGAFTFRPCEGRFARAVRLGYNVIRRGGAAGAVLNSANEAAVEAFLDGKICFGQIVPIVEEILNRSPQTGEINLEALIESDRRARREVTEMTEAGTKRLTIDN